MNKFHRLAMWVLGSIAQYLSLYVGVEQDIPLLVNMSLFIAWLNIAGVFFCAIGFSKITQDYAKKREPMLLGNSPVPWALDAIFDTCFTLYLLSTGFLLTGLAYGMHTFLLIPLRSASRKYNKGLVQLSAVGESKLKL